MNRLKDKVVIVTGANAGIGAASARLFAAEGAKVIASARREELGQQVVEDITARGGEAVFVQGDVSSFADHKRLVEIALDRWGRLDVAFNNAGTGHARANIEDFDEEVWNSVLQVNLTGVFLAMKAQIPALLKSGGGSIINTSSIGGLVANGGSAAYRAAKHGVIGLTKVAALELAKRNVRVNALCPGGTLTDMFQTLLSKNPGIESDLLAELPMGRFSDPMEQAAVALFLASDESSYMTGVALPVDGGFIAR